MNYNYLNFPRIHYFFDWWFCLKKEIPAFGIQCQNRLNILTREDPRGRCARSSQAGNGWGRISPSAKSALKYGAFGAKRSLLSSRFFCVTFSKKNDFFGSRKRSTHSLSASYFRDPFWDPWKKCVEICIWSRCNEAGSICAFGAHIHTDRQTSNKRAQVI